jgi:hypothetical protein
LAEVLPYYAYYAMLQTLQTRETQTQNVQNPERVHVLKTWPPYFDMVANGTKRFELRRDDRGFEVGDALDLQEWDPGIQAYTGKSVGCVITCIVRDAPQFGLMPGFVILGIARLDMHTKVQGDDSHG